MKIVISAGLCLTLLVASVAHGDSFPKGIKYLGGPGFPENKQVKDSWDNRLDVTDQHITFGFRNNVLPPESVPVSAVKRITYGQATTRRVAQWVAIGVLLAPAALLGMLHKSRQHRVLIEWADDQQRDRAMLMQVDKDSIVSVLNHLSFRTRKSIYADEDDKDWLFKNGVKAELDNTAKEPTKP